MTKRNIYVCDKCSKQFLPAERQISLTFTRGPHEIMNKETELDLCATCSSDFIAWWGRWYKTTTA